MLWQLNINPDPNNSRLLLLWRSHRTVPILGGTRPKETRNSNRIGNSTGFVCQPKNPTTFAALSTTAPLTSTHYLDKEKARVGQLTRTHATRIHKILWHETFRTKVAATVDTAASLMRASIEYISSEHDRNTFIPCIEAIQQTNKQFYFTHKYMNYMHNNQGHSSSNCNHHRRIVVTVNCSIQLSTNQIAMYSPQTTPLARDVFHVANCRTTELSQCMSPVGHRSTTKCGNVYWAKRCTLMLSL